MVIIVSTNSFLPPLDPVLKIQALVPSVRVLDVPFSLHHNTHDGEGGTAPHISLFLVHLNYGGDLIWRRLK